MPAPADEQPDAFWSGFIHGVREYLVDKAATPPKPAGSDARGTVGLRRQTSVRSGVMGITTTEPWIEVNISPHQVPDAQLLLRVIDPLVHEELNGQIESWHFFWEPVLCLRFRWGDPAGRTVLEERLGSFLDARQAEGHFVSWLEASHGDDHGRYTGEADSYGPEAWDLIQKDWMNGSELALRLTRLKVEGLLTGNLTPTIEAHWNRHVHLFTNQLIGVSPPPAWWDYEIVLCLSQARGYLALSVQESDSPHYKQMLDHVNTALGAWSAHTGSPQQTTG